MESERPDPAKLFWIDDLEFGVCADPPIEYGEQYWIEYIARSGTPMGAKLTSIRLALVRGYVLDEEQLVDVGCGSGLFIQARGGNTWGYDINPFAVNWLRNHERYTNPYETTTIQNVCLWDSFEHISDVSKILHRVSGYVFVSMPVYRCREHVIASKHFKPGEHYWYFTLHGINRFMRGNRFRCEESSWAETEAGREDIASLVFRRV